MKDKEGLTPLHEAVYYGYTEVVRLLLDVGVDKDVKTKKGETLHLRQRLR